jgi:hypothetical protein
MDEGKNNQEPSDNLDHLEFDSLSPLEEEAANMHEMFLALCKAGFTEKQALTLIALMVEHDSVDTVHFHFNDEMSEEITDRLAEDDEE